MPSHKAETTNSSILGRWKIQEELPAGMGIVFKAWDEELKVTVALKIPAKDAIRRIYEQEARRMLEINPHPNVVMLIEIEQFQGRPVIVMPFYPLGDLSRWIGKPEFRKDVPLILRLAIQICDGMIHVQQNNILVHSDIKPSNILMINLDTIAITDFGLALAHEQIAGMVGTLEYMAPEVFNFGEVSESSDIYSFGATLYEILDGNPPFGSRSENSVNVLKERHSTQKPKTIEGIPTGIWQIVNDCLAKKKEERPNNFRIIRQLLGEAYEIIVGKSPPEPLTPLDLNAWNWTIRGHGLCKLNHHTEEAPYYLKAIEMAPGFAVAHSNLANNYRELNRLDEALLEAKRALSIDPDLQHAHDVMGSVLDELGDIEGAEEHLRKAIRINPTYAISWYNLGVMLDRHGRREEALKCYEETVRLEPHYAQALTNIGVIWAEKNDLQKAEDFYRTALKHDPCLSEANFNLGSLLKNKGRHIEVIQLFDKLEEECG